MSGQKKEVVCGLCGGTGTVQLGSGSKRECISCHGTGIILVDATAKQCTKCGGTGRIGWQRHCDECNSTGWVSR